tara:strand:- start:557 stop:727 length:171 start_codon:yes stop_codon:yes gene_type:complete
MSKIKVVHFNEKMRFNCIWKMVLNMDMLFDPTSPFTIDVLIKKKRNSGVCKTGDFN